jgi:hypothetical protein
MATYLEFLLLLLGRFGLHLLESGDELGEHTRGLLLLLLLGLSSSGSLESLT